MASQQETYQFNMAAAFALAFGKGQIPVRYKPSAGVGIESPVINYAGIGEITEEEVKSLSWLGTPINFKFSLKGGRYNAYDLNGNIEQRELEDFQFPLSTMVEFTRAKNISRTATLGGYGSVKEMYGFEDWKVRIRGFCIYDPGHPQATNPRDQRNKIAAYENLADAIEIVKDDNVFADLGIYNLVIEKVRFGSIIGMPDKLPFELDCVSDEPVELIIK